MSTATGRPRPFLTGVFRTACNYCVRSKKGCSGGIPCKQCQKQGKNCVYARRRMSGPRGRPSGRSHRMRSRAKARRENNWAAAKVVQSTQPTCFESSKLVKQGNEDGSGMNVPRQHDNIATGTLGGQYRHQLLLPIPQDYYHSKESTGSEWRFSSIETTKGYLASIYSRNDGEYPPSDGDRAHTIGKNEGDDKSGSVLEGPSGDIMNIAAMEDFPSKRAVFSSRGGNNIHGSSMGVACHDGIRDMFGANTADKASSEQNDHYIRLAPLAKAHSPLPSMPRNSLGGNDANDKYRVIGCWGGQSPLISVRDFDDSRQSALAKSSSTRDISLHPAPNGNFTQCLNSTSPISEMPQKLERNVTPIGAPLGVIPTSSRIGGLNLQSPVAIDDLLLVDWISNWTEQDSPRLRRERSADLYHGGSRMFPGCVSGRKQQDLSHHPMKQQQQQQQQRNTSQEIFLLKDVDTLDKTAFAAATATANADASLIQTFPPRRINIGQPLIDPPLHQILLEEVILSVSLPSSTGGADISSATLRCRRSENHFIDALPYPRAKVPNREIGLEAHVTSPIISGRTPDEGGVHTVFEQANRIVFPPISFESAILTELDRSIKVAAGSELHDELVDLDCAIMADMRTPLNCEASLIQAMEAVVSDVVLGVNSSNDLSAFASLW